ncbi:related to Dik6, novel virulence factor [Ustilago sp. UG-2017b]|nr:related to Dik6, novel virulence factor [Ustilago sp. UG-2017b]
MGLNSTAQLEMPAQPLIFSHAYGPHSMTFLHRGQTQAQVVNALYKTMYAPITPKNRIYVLASEAWFVLTMVICSVLLLRRRREKLWIITTKYSTYGTLYVGNAITCIIIAVTSYMFAWNFTAIVLAIYSFCHMSVLELFWFIPAPWWSLVVFAYISVHGFVLGCSPRSPLSSLGANKAVADREAWYYLPVPTRPAINNALLLIPTTLFTVTTVTLVCFSGRAYYHAKAISKHLLPAEILLRIHNSAQGAFPAFPDQDVLASDDLIWAGRQVAAEYFEVHRYVSINLSIFAAAAFTIWIPCIVYGLPNMIRLIDHACSLCPHFDPASYKGSLRKLYYLVFKAKPIAEDNGKQLSVTARKMTLLSVGYVVALISAVPAFGFLPLYMVGRSFPREVQRGDISPYINSALVITSIITILCCLLMTSFCSIVTFDPLFRSASGLNLIRCHIPIDITVIKQKNQVIEREPDQPTLAFEAHDDDEEDIERNHGIKMKPSMGTFQSTKSHGSDGENVHDVTNQVVHLPTQAFEVDPRSTAQPKAGRL